MASGPASRVKPVTKQTFGRASPGAAREAAAEALPNGAYMSRGLQIPQPSLEEFHAHVVRLFFCFFSPHPLLDGLFFGPFSYSLL